jgi:DMSO/TMAO reductase YedYZ molybdopterin-dependent catalytic subunit
MSEPFVSRGFVGRRGTGDGDGDRRKRIPPGQYETSDYPVLSAGPTPRVNLDTWDFTLQGLVEAPVRFTWKEVMALPQQDFVVDISCVTKWTHLDMRWHGVSLDVLLEHVRLDPRAAFAIAYSDGGYTTNLPIPDIVNGQAFIAWEYDGKPLHPAHGGPVRMVVPHLYFWKSAKWVRGIRFVEKDQPGFWESLGYNNHGDPWKEERYQGD